MNSSRTLATSQKCAGRRVAGRAGAGLALWLETVDVAVT
jgi:hypothetical protein